MKIVYLDHNVVVDKASWPLIKALSASGSIRVSISIWNIREIVQGRDERIERMNFLESLRPLYIHNAQILQRMETMSFLNSSLFGKSRIPFSMFTETFADFLEVNFRIKTHSNYQLTDYVRTEGNTLDDVVEQGKVKHVDAMRARQRDPDGVKRVEEQANHTHMATLIPRRNLKGQPWETSQIAEILVFCHEHRSKLLRACPALTAENALADARLSDSTRNPKTSDTADLFHSVSALAYADIFFTNDTWARDRVSQAKRTMRLYGHTGCETIRSIEELQRMIHG